MIERALEPVVADGTVAGAALWEVSLSRCDESDTDHAAKWETSDMMYFYPEFVDMTELGEGEIVCDMRKPWGIGGQDPRGRCFRAGRRAEHGAGRRGARQEGPGVAELAAAGAPRASASSEFAPGFWWRV